MPDSMKKLWAWDSANSKWVKILVDSNGRLSIDVNSTALPTGASTSAKQDTMITALELIDDLRGALGSVDTDDLKVDVKDIVDGEIKNYGYDGSAWQRLGLVFSYNDRVYESSSLSGQSGNIIKNTTAVPSGEIYIIQNMYMYHNDATSRDCYIRILSNSTLTQYLTRNLLLDNNVFLSYTNPIILKTDDKISFVWISLSAGTIINWGFWGYKMKIS